MWAVYFLSHVLIATACNFLTLLPCNATIKSCYIHENVCQNTDILFTGFGPGWTFYFVILQLPATNTSQCYTTDAGLSDYCTNPTGMYTSNVTFMLSVVSRQGITDDSVTFATIPPSSSASATLSASACSPSMLNVYGSGLSANNFVFNASNCPTTTTGLLASSATQQLSLYDVQFVGVLVGVVVLATSATVTMNVTTSNTATQGLLPPFNGSLLLVLKGCNACSVMLQTVPALPQYVLVDLGTPPFNYSNVVVFNISTIVPFNINTFAMPTSNPSPPPVTCPDNRAIQIAIVSIMSILLTIIIVAIIRRHYREKAREKSN